MGSSTFLTASWVSIFVSAKPSRTILLIDRSEPRFKSHTGGKIKKNLKNGGNFNVFCKFSAKSDLKLFHPDQGNKRTDIQFSILKRISSAKC